MQFLSALSFLGLMTFIGFSMISKADVYDDDDFCERCETYEEYDETVDPQVIINNNYQVNNYTWVQVERGNNWNHHGYHRPNPPAVLPYPPQYPNYHRPICRIGRAGWGNVFDLWVGNQLFQRAPYGVVLNSYRYLAATGQCIPR